MHCIGEDASERLDVVPARFRVIVTRRPKYTYRACTDGVAQASAPSRLIQAGLPTEATIAHVLVSKDADHLPLYWQAQIMSRQSIDLDRSTLADWVGRAAFGLRPVFDALIADLKRSTKLFMDETRAPVLDPAPAKPRPDTSGPWPVMTVNQHPKFARRNTIYQMSVKVLRGFSSGVCLTASWGSPGAADPSFICLCRQPVRGTLLRCHKL
ncbi:IS66 family transposase [Rhizobium beringeri]|uniref:IS66 family transposase n=1 Tax=Rhizobium beringeri TaxID=3019934 RepID=UPI00398F5E55